MKSLKVLCAILILLGISSISLADAPIKKIVLSPSDDTHTDSNSHNSNYGGQNNLSVSRYEFMETTCEKVAWLKFNLSNVPDGAVVTSAALELYCGLVTETLNVSAHFCSDNIWNELTITYGNQPSYNRTAMSSLCETCGAKSWALVSNSSKRYSWDVTYAVNQTIDGIYGGEDLATIVLWGDWVHNITAEALFYSKEETVTLHLPTLTVVWSHVVPEFPSFLILPLFMLATLLAVIGYRRK